MNATPITLSPRWDLDRTERLVRSRVGRGEAVVIGVSTSDARQLRQLRRLFHRLVVDEGLMVADGKHPDGTGTLVVMPAGTTSAAWWHGEFKTD